MYMCIDKRSHENDIVFQYIVYIIFQMKTKDFNHYILHTYTNILSFLGLLMKKKLHALLICMYYFENLY